MRLAALTVVVVAAVMVVQWGGGGGGGGEAEAASRGHAGSGQSARTSRANGSFLISSSVDRWYLRISRSATVPGLRVPGKGG